MIGHSGEGEVSMTITPISVTRLYNNNYSINITSSLTHPFSMYPMTTRGPIKLQEIYACIHISLSEVVSCSQTATFLFIMGQKK